MFSEDLLYLLSFHVWILHMLNLSVHTNLCQYYRSLLMLKCIVVLMLRSVIGSVLQLMHKRASDGILAALFFIIVHKRDAVCDKKWSSVPQSVVFRNP